MPEVIIAVLQIVAVVFICLSIYKQAQFVRKVVDFNTKIIDLNKKLIEIADFYISKQDENNNSWPTDR